MATSQTRVITILAAHELELALCDYLRDSGVLAVSVAGGIRSINATGLADKDEAGVRIEALVAADACDELVEGLGGIPSKNSPVSFYVSEVVAYKTNRSGQRGSDTYSWWGADLISA